MKTTKNIFEALTTYHYKEANPEENKFTEAFAFLIDYDKNLLKFLITNLVKQKRFSKVDYRNLKVFTQGHHYVENKKVISDIDIKGKNTFFMIENKLESKGSVGQLKKELARLKREQYKNKVLFFITKYKEFDKIKRIIDPIFYPILWSNVYLLIKEYRFKIKRPIYRFLIDSFLEFMEEKEMGPAPLLKQNELSVWPRYTEIRKKFPDYLEFIKNELKKVKNIEGPSRYRGKDWEEDNISFNLPNKKRIQFYVGFYPWLEDKKDYPNYKTGTYCYVAARKRDLKIEQTDTEETRPNKPYIGEGNVIMIDLSLAEIIKGINTTDKQKQRVLETAKKLLSKLLKSHEFKMLEKS